MAKQTEKQIGEVEAVDPLADFPVGADLPAATIVREAHPENDAYKGLYKRVEFPSGATGDDALFRLAIKSDMPDGRTHFLKNKTQLCNVTAEDFRQQFEKQ